MYFLVEEHNPTYEVILPNNGAWIWLHLQIQFWMHRKNRERRDVLNDSKGIQFAKSRLFLQKQQQQKMQEKEEMEGNIYRAEDTEVAS